jgi:hypothetical protein
VTVDPKISKYFSDLAKKRKNPKGFKDKQAARDAQKKSVEARRRKKEHEQAVEDLKC